MSSPSKPIADNGATKGSMFTKEGLPLDHTRFGTAVTTTDVCDGGPARRIDCRPPQLISAPSIRPSKRASPDARRTKSLSEASLCRSLIDDDDDELIDYFGSTSAPLTSPAAPTTVNVMSSSSHWNVHEHNVHTLPSFYPLEKSAVFVPHASAPILASRIAAVLQARSIAASYDAVNAKVDCVSMFLVEFRIRLYRGRGETNHGIIVEVQRRAGFDLSYTQDVYAILDAAEGKNVKECGGHITPIHFVETEGSCCSDEEDIGILENSGGFASLQVISDVLCPRDNKAKEVTVEGRYFAMASLTSLTSLEHMGRTAVHLSNELLISETHVDLRRVVFSYVGQSQDQRPMIQSLEILANVANSSQSPSQLVDLLSQNDYDMFLKLIVNIENAPLNPRAADLSCVILKNICVSQAIVNNLMSSHFNGRLLTALMKAMSYGGKCHAELERHSQQCLEVMQF
mmetsp:Transcript_37967/g.68372  ORF Transcript_37967/g.68372 Transcript_37967/m.68372 type:complete len:457 (-) Transcript_37967:23-1393(-)|eukprot:CAMPEP_0201938890 /NCGR_PEP_ID=MMETSP0903-20130614/42184_1 /ASSEMBLY_ACC=CAM_ASM_000552 /TAXON_ID=420261 /ORGANISM="Thalassiosira antarctica, Strain CCMP982" /LENGTH=456 /DNA_ID=CAMNT_0048480269 /DNA_START=54 /DNA_END=1424 /DNA_ORIENTATION=-